MAGPTFLDQVFRWLGYGQYRSSPQPISDGDVAPLLIDNLGRLVTVAQSSGSSGTVWYKSGAIVKSGIIKASPGGLFTFFGSNEDTSKIWLMIFDSATVPANGAIPEFNIPVDPLKPFSLDLARPKPFTSGISFAASSTAATLTLVTSNSVWLNAERDL